MRLDGRAVSDVVYPVRHCLFAFMVHRFVDISLLDYLEKEASQGLAFSKIRISQRVFRVSNLINGLCVLLRLTGIVPFLIYYQKFTILTNVRR